MKKFKIGDKVKIYNTLGSNYNLPGYIIIEAKKMKELTIREIDYSRPAFWFKEIGGYWPLNWFKLVNEQLEFDFNEKS